LLSELHGVAIGNANKQRIATVLNIVKMLRNGRTEREIFNSLVLWFTPRTVNRYLELARKVNELSPKRLIEKEIQQRNRLIRYYAKKRYSANLIQKKLREKGFGMRREELLAKVREVKGVPKRPKPEVHVPAKYRRVKRKRERVKVPVKCIAVYGTVNGESRWVELAGSGKQVYRGYVGFG